MWQPAVLNPTPDRGFVRELKRIDPELQVVWGFNRYLRNQWAIERRMSPERYFTAYSSVLSDDGPRFIEQPIFDTDQPIYNDDGEQIGYREVGVRKVDLAPEYEWMAFTDRLDGEILTTLRRAYAWHRNQPFSRERAEKQAALEAKHEEEEKQAAFDKRFKDASDEKLEEAFLESRKRVQFGYGAARNET